MTEMIDRSDHGRAKRSSARHVAIVVPSKSHRVWRTLDAFLVSVALSGDEDELWTVMVSIDAPINAVEARFEAERLSRKFGVDVRILSPADRAAIVQWAASGSGVNPTVLWPSLERRGYAAARNVGTIACLLAGAEAILSLDDDMCPYEPFAGPLGQLEWRSAPSLREHADVMLGGADLSVGQYSGYISPMVSIDGIVGRDVVEVFESVLDRSNDVAESMTISELPQLVLAGNRAGATDVVWGGSMGMSADALLAGRLPAFYCPAGARGEDSFFRAALGESVHVEGIRSQPFHDPFASYPTVLDGAGPLNLIDRHVYSSRTSVRFTDALHGWMSYSPLWMTLAGKSPQQIEAVSLDLASIESDLRVLDRQGKSLRMTFDDARSRLQLDWYEFRSTNEFWRSALMPLISTELRAGRFDCTSVGL